MSYYRKKPVVIEAVQFVYPNFDDVALFCAPATLTLGLRTDTGHSTLIIPTLEGNMLARDGDWIIKGIKGELYPIKNEIFLETYEAVDAA